MVRKFAYDEMSNSGKLKEHVIEAEKERKYREMMQAYASATKNGPSFDDRSHNGRLKQAYKDKIAALETNKEALPVVTECPEEGMTERQLIDENLIKDIES